MNKYANEPGWLETGVKFIGNAAKGFADKSTDLWRPITSRAVARVKSITDPSQTYDQHFKRISRRAERRGIQDKLRAQEAARSNKAAGVGYNVGSFFGDWVSDPKVIATTLLTGGVASAGAKAYPSVARAISKVRHPHTALNPVLNQLPGWSSSLNAKLTAHRKLINAAANRNRKATRAAWSYYDAALKYNPKALNSVSAPVGKTGFLGSAGKGLGLITLWSMIYNRLPNMGYYQGDQEYQNPVQER